MNTKFSIIKTKSRKYINYIVKLFRNISKDNVNGYSAECAYYTILSFIPFLILLITLIQYTRIEPTVLFDFISSIIPKSMNSVVIKIMEEVYSKSVSTISISLIFTIWSAGKGLYALIRGLYDIYDINEDKKNSGFRLRIRAIIGILFFVITIITTLSALVFSEAVINTLKVKCGFLLYFTAFFNIITKVVFLVITIIIFTCIYKFLPKHSKYTSFKSQLGGGIIGAFLLNIISLVFSKYLDIFKNFSITYGSLTALMLVMMWTYSCFYTVLFGAEINKLKNN